MRELAALCSAMSGHVLLIPHHVPPSLAPDTAFGAIRSFWTL